MNETVWFEDFERDNWIARLVRTRTKYEKTELSFSKADVRYTRLVTRGGALGSITRPVPPDSLRPANFLNRILSTPIMQVALQDGSSLFFDLIRRRRVYQTLRAGIGKKRTRLPV